MKYVLSPLADKDIDDIWLYIATDNENAANKMLHKIYAAIEKLAEFPMMGRERPELGDLRSLSVSPYVVFYHIHNVIDVVRVLHSSRDIEHMFNA